MKRLLLIAMIVVATTTATLSQAQNSGLKLPPYKNLKLPNGMTLLLMERHELPLVSFRRSSTPARLRTRPGRKALPPSRRSCCARAPRRAAPISFPRTGFYRRAIQYHVTSEYATVSADFMKKDIGHRDGPAV